MDARGKACKGLETIASVRVRCAHNAYCVYGIDYLCSGSEHSAGILDTA